MRLVAVPADADAGVVFGAQHLRDCRRWSAECLDLFDDGTKPARNRIRLAQAALGVVVAEAEPCDAALAFELPELERLQGQGCDALDQLALKVGRDEIGGVA